jgi:hypothetical protein
MRLIPLPAFQDDDLWFLPGDAQPVMSALQQEGLHLDAILVTHHERGQSVEKLASPPGETRVCRTPEYTLSNLKPALAVEPDNLQLVHYNQRRAGPRANPHGLK